jgi:hypothetical protein
MKRRDVLKTAALSGLIPLINVGNESKAKNNQRGEIKEPVRTTRIVKTCDVIVCGGGPAGIAAAINAARSGAKTVLIEMYGCLGGIWTTGLLSNLIDFQNKPGIMKELVDNLEEHDAQYTAKVYDAELMKLMLDKMCIDSGVEIRLYTRVVGAYKNQNRLTHILTESFSGREAWEAKVFIDTTGNGELATQAGNGFDMGHPETSKTQPMSLMAILTGLDEDKVAEAGMMAPKGKTTEQSKGWFYNQIKSVGIEASYTKPTLFAIRPGLVAMMANHQYGVSAADADQLSKATIEARAEVNKIIDSLRKSGGLWSDVRIVATGNQIGIREARRIHGIYTVTKEDLIKGASFEDGICKVTFTVDVHALEKKDGGGYGSEGVKMKPYEIPLRSLIARDVDGLMMAGRCISGDFFAHASYRVTGNAVAMGEAAGKTAAFAALNNVMPRKVNFNEVFI